MRTQDNLPVNYALFVVKPDAVRDFLDVKITEDLETRGLLVVKRKFVNLTPEQAARVYSEKKDFNYFPQLVEFMSSSPSLCLILKCYGADNAVKEAKAYRDWARSNLKLQNFELTKEDLTLLNQGVHPKQTEITRTMALENLIHVSDDFCAQTPVLGEIFNEWDIQEVYDRDAELYKILHEANIQVKPAKELVLYHHRTERI